MYGPGLFADSFAAIDSLKAELDKRRPLTQGEIERLQEDFAVEYTHDSTAIEGNTLTLQETALVLAGVTISQKPLKDHLEVFGHKEAFSYVCDLVTNKTPLSEDIVKKLHTLVLMARPNDGGVWRRVPVRILTTFYLPPQPERIQAKMDRVLADPDISGMHPLQAAALFHLRFEGIHPFIDGNGRIGRLILNLSLMQNGYLPISIKYMQRSKYYDAFESYYREGDDGEAMTRLVVGYERVELEKRLALLGPAPCQEDGWQGPRM